RKQLDRSGSQHACRAPPQQPAPVRQIAGGQFRIGHATGAEQFPQSVDDVVHSCFHVEVACAMVSPASSLAKDCRKKVLRPFFRKPERHLTTPLRTGAKYCTFISIVAPAPKCCLRRWPIEISSA